MKRLGRYWINHEIKWITASGVMMGIAFFAQALLYFALEPFSAITTGEWILMVILPMIFEAAWCILLRGVRLKPAFTFGILGAVICLLLMVQGLYEGGFFRVTLSAIMYPIAALFLVVIVCGYFPYRLFGFVALAAVVALRVLFFGPIVQLFRGEWLELLRSLPGICNSAALWFLFGGIRATRIKQEE